MKAVSFIDELLAEQQQLTAVERFAQRPGALTAPAPRLYQDLIPLERPRPGEQYAFRVDLDLCTGCKACVSACHSLNGLDEDETWRTTGLLHGGTANQPYQQTITTACHHCLEPACLEGCPVLAYERDELTGIVRHLDDQCIGCQYCILKCPYDVPKYSTRRGIVRKCDMCHDRLAEGEAPACAQSCPSSAITIRVVATAGIERDCADPEARLVPGAFVSNYTKPATTYASRNPFPENCGPANAGQAPLEPAHWPLVWMLVLTQTAAGLFLAGLASALIQPRIFLAEKSSLWISGFVLLAAGLTASVWHLGRPLGAWRVFLGLRRSWLSREVLAFTFFTGSAAAFLLTDWFGNAGLALPLAVTTSILGLVSVFCSAMIYIDTRRPAWTWRQTLPKFFGATLLLGATGAAALLQWSYARFGGIGLAEGARAAAWIALFLRAALFLSEMQGFERSLLIPVGLFCLSTFFALLSLANPGSMTTWAAAMAFLSTFSSQIFERYRFFVTSSGPKLPGPAK